MKVTTKVNIDTLRRGNWQMTTSNRIMIHTSLLLPYLLAENVVCRCFQIPLVWPQVVTQSKAPTGVSVRGRQDDVGQRRYSGCTQYKAGAGQRDVVSDSKLVNARVHTCCRAAQDGCAYKALIWRAKMAT